MNMLILSVLVFISSAAIDFANTRYILAVSANSPYKAASWSVLQWLSSLVGFLVAIKITLWMLPVELLGLFCGTLLSMKLGARRLKEHNPAPKS